MRIFIELCYLFSKGISFQELFTFCNKLLHNNIILNRESLLKPPRASWHNEN